MSVVVLPGPTPDGGAKRLEFARGHFGQAFGLAAGPLRRPPLSKLPFRRCCYISAM
jgi:hypothetical protein